MRTPPVKLPVVVQAEASFGDAADDGEENRKFVNKVNKMRRFVVFRNIIIAVAGIWYFEFYCDYRLPDEDNLLLFFVAIPVIWATISQLWTSYSYKEISSWALLFFTHILSMLMLLGTVFLVSAVLNTISETLDHTGVFMFHAVGWTAIAAMIMYDIVDSGR